MSLAPISAVERYTAQFQHHQDIRVGELILEGEADNVEGGQRPLRLQRAKGQAALPEFPFHIRPRGIDAFAGDLRQVVQDGVKDLEAEMRHPDLIGVGEGEGKAEETARIRLPDGVQLAAGVATWFLDGKENLAGIVSGPICHYTVSFVISRYFDQTKRRVVRGRTLFSLHGKDSALTSPEVTIIFELDLQ